MSLIEGVVITPLKQIPDERGRVMHLLRCDDPGFEQFGEIYFSIISPGMVKAWRMHTKMTMNLEIVRSVGGWGMKIQVRTLCPKY